jgi:DNA-binding GntR family transcriptional regulator
MIAAPATEPAEGKTDRVAEAIRAGIRAGLFVPGQHLVEADLTQQLQISRSSLREALRHLHGEGIVAMSRYRGTHICRLTRNAADDLLEVLEVLVRVAARRAAVSSQTKRIVMDTAVAAAERHRASADHRSYVSVRQAFYDALFEISGNRELSRVIPLRRADLFRAQIRPYQTFEQQHIHADGYLTIAQSVLAGDEGSSDAAVGNHFAATRVMVDELPVIAFATPDASDATLN